MVLKPYPPKLSTPNPVCAAVQEILAEYKIGRLAPGDAGAAKPALSAGDPWASEPGRHPALLVRSAKPFNSETPLPILAASLITPNDIFYIRNHLPVPTDVDLKTYKLVIQGVRGLGMAGQGGNVRHITTHHQGCRGPGVRCGHHIILQMKRHPSPLLVVWYIIAWVVIL